MLCNSIKKYGTNKRRFTFSGQEIKNYLRNSKIIYYLTYDKIDRNAILKKIENNLIIQGIKSTFRAFNIVEGSNKLKDWKNFHENYYLSDYP